MLSLNTLRTRLEYRGGTLQESRFQLDKLKSLKKALLYSYQAATAVIDGKMFRCLMNPNKQKADYDCKILSIPYEDICLGSYDIETNTEETQKPNEKTTQSYEATNIEPGKVFLWKETNTRWITYLKFLEEDSYFRGEVYKCEDIPVEINGNPYYVYIRGPVETTIPWNQKAGIVWNTINYSLIMYITKNEETLDYFHRFKYIDIPREDGNGVDTWEIKTVDPYSADGIIEICLGEYFNNEFKSEDDSDTGQTSQDVYIEGASKVKPYTTVEYTIHGLEDGDWIINNKNKAKFVSKKGNTVTIEIVAGKSGAFTLTYHTDVQEVVLPITIESI